MKVSESPERATEKAKERRRRIARLLLAAGGSAAAVLMFVNEPASMRSAMAMAMAAPAEAGMAPPAFAFRWAPAMAEDLLAEIHAAARTDWPEKPPGL